MAVRLIDFTVFRRSRYIRLAAEQFFERPVGFTGAKATLPLVLRHRPLLPKT